MSYDDKMNSNKIDYQEKYHILTEQLTHLIDSKTQITKNHVFYDLIQVSELQKILDKSQEKNN